VLVVVLIAVLVAFSGGGAHHRREFKVPYGETMTAKDYTEIHLGEEDAVVLERLVESGRPERFTEPYVLDLFPPREEGVYCTYFEFSDKPRIFARLCFSESTGYLEQKLKHDVFHPLRLKHAPGQKSV
jgi:hypothetical protein